MVRGRRRGRHLDTCRASASPKLGLGVVGVVASALAISNLRPSGQKWDASGVTMVQRRWGRKSRGGRRGGDDRWGPPVSRAREFPGRCRVARPIAGWARAGPRAGGAAGHARARVGER